MESIDQVIIAAEVAALGKNLNFDAGLYQGGGNFSHHSGSSQEFLDYRDYTPGDDIRQLDWSVYARSEKLTIKCYQQEVAPRLDIMLDSSRSMQVPMAKKQATMAVAASLATVAANSKYSTKTWHSGDGYNELINGRKPAREWIVPDFESQLSPQEAVEVIPPLLQNGGVAFFISDLMWLDKPDKMLATISHRSDYSVVIQILSREEAEPTLNGAHRLHDGESGDELELVINEDIRSDYLDNLHCHQQNWSESCDRGHVIFLTIIAEDFLEDMKLEELQQLGIII